MIGAPATPSAPVGEITEVHTRLVNLSMALEESRSYWEFVDLTIPVAKRAKVAFAQRWFGAKSQARIQLLLANFAHRYDRSASAIATLHRWKGMDLHTRRNVCHWHLQWSDPLYRDFTGELLIERRNHVKPIIDRSIAFRWLKERFADRWSDATTVQIASKLLAAAGEVGLLSKAQRGERTLVVPTVSDQALTYWLYFLRETHFDGTLWDNRYLRSVGLTDAYCDQRLRSLTALTYRRMGQLVEIDWTYANLTAWAEATL